MYTSSRERALVALMVLPLFGVAACAPQATNKATESASAEAPTARERPELSCTQLSFSTPDYEPRAAGTGTAIEAASPYVEDGEATEVFEESANSATVFVMDGAGEPVAEVRVQDYGDGWLIGHARACQP